MSRTPSKTAAAKVVRARQEAEGGKLGPFFASLHQFVDRLEAEFFSDFQGTLPMPVISLERDQRNRRGYYRTTDELALTDRINLNVHVLRNGYEAAETLAHEYVHLWQAASGKPCVRNYHAAAFHERMKLMGIITEGPSGEHVALMETWYQWLERNADLNLDKFVLPGMDAKPRQGLYKFQCSCGDNFRCRRPVVALCVKCDTPFEQVATRTKKKEQSNDDA